ncbi:MAG: EAL domain-containing protein, partial [Gallionellaceae bacterium]|nr:EAL domain-containing protein [Gallionellaceae bacterium]
RAALEISLRGGFLERHELLLHYQLQRDLRNGQIIGVEALLRWQHPEWGLLAPDRFIEAAERIGIIAHIDEWVLLQSCIQCKKWQGGWPHDLPVSVNCSAALLKQPNLLGYLKQVLTQTGLSASCLILEFTERVVIEDAPGTIFLLQEIRALGIRLSIDDFGIGYSSLNYLKLLPVDQLKIDQSFVSDLGNANTAAITRAVINLGHNLHLEVIAEGVETEWQLAALHDMGCDGGQGYYFDLPQSAEGFTGLLQQHKSLGETTAPWLA